MKKIRAVISLLFFAIMLIAFGKVSAEAGTEMSDEVFVDNENGTVEITFTVDKDTSILIMVDIPSDKVDDSVDAKKAARYTYKLVEGKNVVTVPLTKGAGDYIVRVTKVLSNGKAAVLKSKTVTLNDTKAKKVFDVANLVVDYESSEDFVKKAQELTKKCKNDDAKVKKIYTYVVENFGYDYELLDEKVDTMFYKPDNTVTYERKLGICYDISSLFAAMLRSVGVEARVVTGYTPNVQTYHAWTEVYNAKKDEWYSVDCTYDMCLYSRKSSKKYTMIKKTKDYSKQLYVY